MEEAIFELREKKFLSLNEVFRYIKDNEEYEICLPYLLEFVPEKDMEDLFEEGFNKLIIKAKYQSMKKIPKVSDILLSFNYGLDVEFCEWILKENKMSHKDLLKHISSSDKHWELSCEEEELCWILSDHYDKKTIEMLLEKKLYYFLEHIILNEKLTDQTKKLILDSGDGYIIGVLML